MTVGWSGGEQPEFGLGGGFSLRAWRAADAGVLAESCRDPEILRWNRPEALTVEGARERILRWRGRWEAGAAAIWAVVAVGSGGGAGSADASGFPGAPGSSGSVGVPVGLIGLADIDLAGGSGEFLYWLLPGGRGYGVMTRATVRVSRWAVESVGLQRLRITHSVRNPASCRVAEGAGFAYEGTMRRALLHADGWHDEHLHARVAGDPWPGGV
ncbi:GNAT family protein [Streptomyces sp. NPDC089919]|uniref:GNAT family N-acetyltransferase n=1 Tax=Streptomyces sp. NPDC089919 TaxID=3155188 RepID=UPI003441B8C1